ncbi:MAG: zinc-dependent metalloprotease [Actinomycetota bacterium]
MASRELVDWAFAARVGRMIAGPGPIVSEIESSRVSSDFQRYVREADRLVREYTELTPRQGTLDSSVVSRGAWIQSNIVSIRHMLAPVADRLATRFPAIARSGTRKLSAGAMGLQIGLLLGYVSRKVLGQYDLLLASGDNPGHVYFVGPNIIAAERSNDLDADDFRLWIALHEITHRTQFMGVAWLKDRVQSLVAAYLEGISIDPDRMRKTMKRFAETAFGGRESWRQMNLLTMFLSSEQRDAVEQMQSLMSVIEGHGNFVMDGIGEKQIPSYAQLRRALHARREEAGASERAFQRFIALDLKYEQYAVGQAFFDEVFALGGMDAVNRVWSSADSVPSQQELRDPSAWLQRVGNAHPVPNTP